MKVVIFCGGMGVRMGDETRRIPKPMVRIGNQPILWHIMGYYADHGFDEFVLCLGYKGDVIKRHVLSQSNDGAGSAWRRREFRKVNGEGVGTYAVGGWNVTFVDTGLYATIAERLKAVQHQIGDDAAFLATYGDALTDAPLDDIIERADTSGKICTFLSVRPPYSTHVVDARPDGTVVGVRSMAEADIRINGGYFVLRREIFDWIRPGDELVEETFARLIPLGEVRAVSYDGFYGPMDTIKDLQHLRALEAAGTLPWRAHDHEVVTQEVAAA